jgi:hypothetical protein
VSDDVTLACECGEAEEKLVRLVSSQMASACAYLPVDRIYYGEAAIQGGRQMVTVALLR